MFCARSFLIQLFLVPLNAHLEGRCLERMDAQLRGHTETSGQRMEPDLEALMSLPSVPYEACDRQPGRVSSLSMARYKTNDCGRCSGGNSLLSAALPEARTKRSGSSLTSCTSCLVRM